MARPRSRHQETVGPVSETDKDTWCIDCGHYVGVHKDGKCNYWTDLCKCEGFVSRSEALAAVRSKEEKYLSSESSLKDSSIGG